MLGTRVRAAELSARSIPPRGSAPPIGSHLSWEPKHRPRASHQRLALTVSKSARSCHSMKRHYALCPGPREVDVGSLGGAAFLLADVCGEVGAVVGVEESGNFGLDMRNQSEANPSVALDAQLCTLARCS